MCQLLDVVAVAHAIVKPERRSNDDGAKQQHVGNFNEFAELSRLCELGGAQSAICLMRSAWLQEQLAEARRTGVPFVMPSRNALPPEASTRGPSQNTT